MSGIELECISSCENYLNMDIQNSKRNSIKGKTLKFFSYKKRTKDSSVLDNFRLGEIKKNGKFKKISKQIIPTVILLACLLYFKAGLLGYPSHHFGQSVVTTVWALIFRLKFDWTNIRVAKIMNDWFSSSTFLLIFTYLKTLNEIIYIFRYTVSPHWGPLRNTLVHFSKK